ncbi:MAG TPA: polysaccharide deacetylase family protein [Gallionella sp.]|nr:polysaccharide deacetylase family protein [Gallionella sp.]
MTPLWRATTALRLTTLLHAGCAVLTVLRPAIWPWALGLVVANHLLLGMATMWPRSHLLGANMTRLPAAAIRRNEVALTFDDGPDPEITPKVLDLLDQYGAKASFFCIGERVAAYPELAREIIRRGHSVENHTYRHANVFALFGPVVAQREIKAAQNDIQTVTGIAPLFFRAPMGFRNPFLIPLVERADLRYASWTRRGYDTVARQPEKVLQRLLRGIAAGDILLLHDGCATHVNSGTPLILEVLPCLLERLQAHQLKAVSLPAACKYVG